MAGVPSPAGLLHPCLRLLHGEDGVPEDPYVQFFIHVGTRRIELAKATANPDSAWATQQARNLSRELEGDVRLLIHDRDAKYSRSFDEVFRSEGIRIVRTPFRAPRANAYAERWVRTVREECLDRLLIVSSRHLDRVLREYVDHYNRERPHRGLELETPEPKNRAQPTATLDVKRRDRLGGLIHEYHALAA